MKEKYKLYKQFCGTSSDQGETPGLWDNVIVIIHHNLFILLFFFFSFLHRLQTIQDGTDSLN